MRRVTITFSDDEYATLEAEAAGRGELVESLVREVVAHRPSSPRELTRPISPRAIEELLYRRCVIAAVPSKEPETTEQAEERERLAALFAAESPISEIIIEDRGPR